jgi:hypothetical protein
MDPTLLPQLQAAADAIDPGMVQVSIDVRPEIVHEPDPRPGRQHRNRLAKVATCDAGCDQGTVQDPENLPTACEACGGLGYTETETTHPHPHVIIKIVGDDGHAISETSFGVLSGKGRVDRRPERSLDEMVGLVRHCVGCAALENGKYHPHRSVPLRLAQTWLTAAVKAGTITQAEADPHLHRWRDHHGRDQPVKATPSTAAPGTVDSVFVRACQNTKCGRKTSGGNLEAVVLSFPETGCPGCGSTDFATDRIDRTVTGEVTTSIGVAGATDQAK